MESAENTARAVRPARPSASLRRGRTKRGFWISVTTQEAAIIGAVERAVRDTGVVVAVEDRELMVAGLADGSPPHALSPVGWSYQWGDLLVRRDGDGMYRIYRTSGAGGDAAHGVSAAPLEPLTTTSSREHALLEMGALLQATGGLDGRVSAASRPALVPQPPRPESKAA